MLFVDFVKKSIRGKLVVLNVLIKILLWQNPSKFLSLMENVVNKVGQNTIQLNIYSQRPILFVQCF